MGKGCGLNRAGGHHGRYLHTAFESPQAGACRPAGRGGEGRWQQQAHAQESAPRTLLCMGVLRLLASVHVHSRMP